MRLPGGKLTAVGGAERLRPRTFFVGNGVIFIADAAVGGGKILIIRWNFAS